MEIHELETKALLLLKDHLSEDELIKLRDFGDHAKIFKFATIIKSAETEILMRIKKV
jgi:hypothetical protein